jgi:hypothetical protein
MRDPIHRSIRHGPMPDSHSRREAIHVVDSGRIARPIRVCEKYDAMGLGSDGNAIARHGQVGFSPTPRTVDFVGVADRSNPRDDRKQARGGGNRNDQETRSAVAAAAVVIQRVWR